MTEKTLRDRIVELKAQQIEHLQMVGEVHQMLERCRETYDKVLLAAHDLGVTNTAIAKEIGKSETSVRLYIKRRQDGVQHR